MFILDQTTIKKLLTIYKLTIPDFQRNFVWKQSKKQQLLDSLFRGFPIGAITLYDDKKSYYVIDGLQRINTLNQYLSKPYTVISFSVFFEKVEREVEEFLGNEKLDIALPRLKKYIKKWYERLDNLYEFEKISVLYNVFKEEDEHIAKVFENLEIVERLLDILKSKIEIVHDDIALIIYKGDKNDLPELFKNINTGSVALSQYEILQSVWNDYVLNRSLLLDTHEAFSRELELIRDNYEIGAIKQAGKFDIFKNLIGLNHIICCKKDSDVVFRFSAFKKLAKPVCFEDGVKKYYENDSIAFEIYSTILCNASNRIVKAIDLIYRNPEDTERISVFINCLNKVIVDAIDIAIRELRGKEINPSKYHSIYIIAGIVFSKYEIDIENLKISESEFNQKLYDIVLDIDKHVQNKWFIDENRQMGFFNIKTQELLDIKRTSIKEEKVDFQEDLDQEGKLTIRINEKIISAFTVKDFYREIFEYLLENQMIRSWDIPYATGKKRYLINWENYHINGDIFVSPIKVGDYYIETHKSKAGAIRDIHKFLERMGVDVGYR